MVIIDNVDVDGEDDTHSLSYIVESKWRTDELSRIVFHDSKLQHLEDLKELEDLEDIKNCISWTL